MNSIISKLYSSFLAYFSVKIDNKLILSDSGKWIVYITLIKLDKSS